MRSLETVATDKTNTTETPCTWNIAQTLDNFWHHVRGKSLLFGLFETRRFSLVFANNKITVISYQDIQACASSIGQMLRWLCPGAVQDRFDILTYPVLTADLQVCSGNVTKLLKAKRAYGTFTSNQRRENRGKYLTNKLRGLSPLANYTNRATAACRRSSCQLLRIEGCRVVSAVDPPTAVISVF
jgi:hypothetical protein